MAIAIPILMSVSGATAAISAAVGLTAAVGAVAGAAIVGVGTSLIASKTGISDKINKAASKVFGEDLVKAGNIVGAAMLATGTIGGAPSGGGATSSAMEGLDGAKSFTDLAQGASQSGGVLSDMAAASAGADLTMGASGGIGAGLAEAMPESLSAVSSASQFQPIDFASQVQGGGGILSDISDKIGGTWKGLGDKGQAAVIQGAGGALDAYMRNKQTQQLQEKSWARQDLRNSGSGFFDKYAYGAGG